MRCKNPQQSRSQFQLRYMNKAFGVTAIAVALALPFNPAVAQSTQTFTPPGEVLRLACSKVNAGDSSARDMFDRGYCLRFIEAALMFDRQQVLAEERRTAEAARSGNPDPLSILRPVRDFCFPHGKAGVSMIATADVARGLAQHLGGLTSTQLDRTGTSDDTQMRLLTEFLKQRYPCTK